MQQLTLYIGTRLVRSWPLLLPKTNPVLPDHINKAIQEAYLQGATAIAKSEMAGLLGQADYRFVVEIKAQFPEEEQEQSQLVSPDILIPGVPCYYSNRRLARGS